MAGKVEVTDGAVTFIGKEAVDVYRLATILSGMRLEHRTGMRLTNKAPSCFTIVRREFGLKGNKEKLIAQVEEILAKAKAEVPVEDKRTTKPEDQPLLYVTAYPNHWGRGETAEEAKAQARKAGGRGSEWATFLLPPGADKGWVDDFGSVRWSFPESMTADECEAAMADQRERGLPIVACGRHVAPHIRVRMRESLARLKE